MCIRDSIRDRATEGTLLAHSQGGVPNVIVNVGGKGPRELGRLIGYGVTLALQPGLTPEDAAALLG